MLERENGTSHRLMINALLLSLLDFTVIQIQLNEVAQQAVNFDCLLLTWIFPSPSTVMPFVLWLGLLLLRLKAPDKTQARIYAYDWVFAALFSLVLLLGHSFWVCNSYTLLTANRSCKLLALFSLAGLTGLTVNLLRWAKYGFRRLLCSQLRLPKLWDRHPFLFPFAVIFLLWLPYALLKYPGGMDFDSYYQLLEPLGLFPLTNHWPVASSYFFAGCYLLGKTLFGSSNAGLFTLVVLQSLFCAACMARSLKAMHTLRLNNGLLVLSLAAYSLATIFSRYTTSVGKDSLFACALLLCLSLIAELLFGALPASPARLIGLAAACLLMGVLRSNGPHLLLALLLVLVLAALLLRRRAGRPPAGRVAAAVGTALCLCLCYLNLLLPALGIPGTSAGEALSLPLMQTARYVKYCPEDVTEEERQIIDQVVDYDRLPLMYLEHLSDYVKGLYRGDGESLARYFKVWFRQGLRHPEVYFSATFNNVYGYFYPGAREDSMGIYMQYDPVPDAPVQLFSLPEEAAVRRAERLDKLSDFILAFENFPLFYPVCNGAVQVWLALYLALAALCRRRVRLLILLVPSVVSVLICVAGPTFFHNGLRYALPVIFANPFLFSLCLQKLIPDNNS
ncbi:MAG: DUF6020 family protein [Candidatus Limivicinus sp.]